MVRENDRNIGHLHRILISSVETNWAMESKINVENNCGSSMNNSKLLCQKTIAIAK